MNKRWIVSVLMLSLLLVLSACSGGEDGAENGEEGGNASTSKDGGNQNSANANSQQREADPTSNESLAQGRAMADKAWSWIEKKYNAKPTSRQDPGGWGPECDPAFSAFVLLGGLKSGYLKPADKRVALTLESSIFANQASLDGANPYWKISSPSMGQSLYITSVSTSLMCWLRDNAESDLPAPLAKQLEPRIDGALAFLAASQIGVPSRNGRFNIPQSYLEEGDKYNEADSPYYGGWAYGADDPKRSSGRLANLSTTSFALDAFAADGRTKKDDPIYKAAMTYLKRSQNVEEGTDAPQATRRHEGEGHPDTGEVVVKPSRDDENFGGAPYSPTESKASVDAAGDNQVVLRSYGSMTYTLLRGYMHIGMTRDDPAVQYALKWLTDNFSVDFVPGFQNTEKEPNADQSGLYYQYLQIARTFNMMGIESFRDADGIEHQWREEWISAVAERQQADGSWMNASDRFFEGAEIICTCYIINGIADVLRKKAE